MLYLIDISDDLIEIIFSKNSAYSPEAHAEICFLPLLANLHIPTGHLLLPRP